MIICIMMIWIVSNVTVIFIIIDTIVCLYWCGMLCYEGLGVCVCVCGVGGGVSSLLL